GLRGPSLCFSYLRRACSATTRPMRRHGPSVVRPPATGVCPGRRGSAPASRLCRLDSQLVGRCRRTAQLGVRSVAAVALSPSAFGVETGTRAVIRSVVVERGCVLGDLGRCRLRLTGGRHAESVKVFGVIRGRRKERLEDLWRYTLELSHADTS